MTVEREVLEKSIALVNKGWTKGAYSRQVDETHISYCLYGAVAEAWSSNTMAIEFRELANLLGKTAVELFPGRAVFRGYAHRTITDFNDHKDTTKEDVIQVFEKTLANLE